MSIAKKIVLLVFCLICMFVSVNIVSLQYFTGRYFYDYLQDRADALRQIKQNEDTQRRITGIETEIFEIIAQYPDQAPELLEKYQIINQDLSKLSTALEFYIDTEPRINREIVTDYLKEVGVAETDLDSVIDSSSIRTFLESAPLSLNPDLRSSPERIFVSKVFTNMFFVNVALLIVSMLVVYFFTKQMFRPIDKITRNIDRIIHSSIYDKIQYQHTDEFTPLITSINKLNNNLSHQENIRSTFLTDMSHELKTPMAAIRVYLEGIQDGVIKLNEKNISALIEEIKRLTRIVESMMTYQTFEENTISFRISSVDLSELTSWMQDYYQQELRNTEQKICLVPWESEHVCFDRDYLVQIFHNVITNFLRYAGEKSTLTIQYHSVQGGDMLTFTDDGVGVCDSEIPYLKEKFYQVDKSKTGDIAHRGIGVGLSIVDKIIREIGGHMDLISKPWEGFRIALHFPTQKIPLE